MSSEEKCNGEKSSVRRNGRERSTDRVIVGKQVQKGSVTETLIQIGNVMETVA